MTKPGTLVVNIQRCVACGRCELECAVAHSNGKDLSLAMLERPAQLPRLELRSLNGRHALAVCHHCDNPPCVAACPADALKKEGPGYPVLYDREACTGCKQCIEACPFGVIKLDRDEEHIVKCDLCTERLAAGKEPACVEACRTRAIEFRDREAQARAGHPAVYTIDPEKCIACGKCRRVCPVEAIRGAKKTPHEIIQERCIKCGECFEACPVEAISVS